MRTFLTIILSVLGPAIALAQPSPLDPAVINQAALAAPGAQPVGPIYHGSSTEEDGHTDWNMPLEPGKCYWFSGVGGPGVRHLYLYLWNPSGKRVADKKPDAPQVLMTYCPEVPGMFHLQAKTGEGFGTYAVGIYSKQAPPRQAPPPPPDLGRLCDQQAAAAAPGARRVGAHFTGSGGRGDRSDWTAMLTPGSCYWFIAHGGPGVKQMYLYLWDPANKRITESKSTNPSAMVGHCPVVPGMYKFQAKIGSGGGAYAVGVYAKPM